MARSRAWLTDQLRSRQPTAEQENPDARTDEELFAIQTAFAAGSQEAYS